MIPRAFERIQRRADAFYISRGRLGWGLFAARKISGGEQILSFSGPIINFLQAATKGADQSYALQVGPDSYIDLDSPGRYGNHSCEPNAGIKENNILFAIAPIDVDDEICYDYSTTMDENWWTMRCACGSPACRSVVRDFRCLPPVVRERYLLLRVVQDFIAIRSGQNFQKDERSMDSGATSERLVAFGDADANCLRFAG